MDTFAKSRWITFAASALVGIASRGPANSGEQAHAAGLMADAMEAEYRTRFPGGLPSDLTGVGPATAFSGPESVTVTVDGMTDEAMKPKRQARPEPRVTDSDWNKLDPVKFSLIDPTLIDAESFRSARVQTGEYTIYGEIEKRPDGLWFIPKVIQPKPPFRHSGPAVERAGRVVTLEELMKRADDPEVKDAIGPPTRFA